MFNGRRRLRVQRRLQQFFDIDWRNNILRFHRGFRTLFFYRLNWWRLRYFCVVEMLCPLVRAIRLDYLGCSLGDILDRVFVQCDFFFFLFVVFGFVFLHGRLFAGSFGLR